MQNTSGWFIGLGACLLALFGCGGEAQEFTVESTSVDVGQLLDANAAAPSVLLVFAVHGFGRGELDAKIAPNLARLRKQGVDFPGHVIQSTGIQSEMSTLMTGRSPLHHGVGSVHEGGLSALADSEKTLAEFLGEQGFATLASMALPQFSPEISGLHQGFDSYVGPNVLGDSLRRSDRVEMVARDAWKDALAGGKPVFAWVQSADAMRPGLDPSPNVMKHVRARLSALVPQNPGLQQSVELVDKDPSKFEEVRRAILRSRGSSIHAAFMAGVREGQLADLDAVVGRFMNHLEKAGRVEQALVALISTQGPKPESGQSRGGAVFRSEMVRSPMWLWSPTRLAPGTDARVLSSRYVPDVLCDLMGFQFGDQYPSEPVATVWDAGLARRAVVGANLHLEENSAAGWLGFDDSGQAILRAQGLDESQQEQWAQLQAAAAQVPVRFGYELRFDCAQPVTVRWRMVKGRFRGARVEPTESGRLGRQTPLTGSVTLEGQGTLWVETFAREAPVVWSVDGLAAGEPSPYQAAMQVIRAPYGTDWPETGSKSQAEVHRDAGIWTRVIVQGEAGRPVRIHAGLVPKKQDGTRRPIKMEWTVGFEDQVERLAGREDAVLLTAKTPLNVQFKEVPGHTLSLSIQVQDHWLSPLEMSYEGKSLAPAGQRNVYTPGWWPGVTEALFEEQGLVLGPGLSLRRFGPLPKEHKALSADSSFFVSRLGRGE
ncbi:MAG: sulfatase-like hydrolase/transferase [Planctomycetes bacterium]|nr:sulfatase-like hydrolase/transferase [Planctomycetota bacterium]